MIRKLIEKIEQTGAPVVVGLDPSLAFLPQHLIEKAKRRHEEAVYGDDELEIIADALWKFNRGIVDEIADLVPAVKPQIAMYEQFGIPGLITYQRTVRYCREKGLIVIGDVKRGDIGSTSAAYASAHLGRIQFEGIRVPVFGTDFATVNPYLGSDGVKPFIDVCNAEDKGIFVLVKTSNPSSGELQDVLTQDGRPVYELMGEKVREWGELSMDGEFSNVGAVVGATYPEQAARLRELMPHTFILAPGYGAQGATAQDLKPFFLEGGKGAIVNSSRGIIAAYTKEKYAKYGPEGYAEAARAAVTDMIEDLRSVVF